MRRIYRYNNANNQERVSRSDKNKELYNNIGSNQRYTNLTDVTNTNAIELNRTSKNYHTREGYHQMKEYENVLPTFKEKKELEEFNHLYQDHENKIYDINYVLEYARKNRIEKDALEEKRKLKNTSYNILASLNKEELEQYRKEKKERLRQPDEEELRELIDTITSKTLVGEIDKATSVDLLSDLMATNILDKVEKPEKEEQLEEKPNEEKEDKLSLSKEILDEKQIEQMNKLKEKDTKEEKLSEADTDFYTRSMDLSDKDFDLDDEFSEKKIPVALKIFLVLILLAVLLVAVYFIWQEFFK